MRERERERERKRKKEKERERVSVCMCAYSHDSIQGAFSDTYGDLPVCCCKIFKAPIDFYLNFAVTYWWCCIRQGMMRKWSHQFIVRPLPHLFPLSQILTLLSLVIIPIQCEKNVLLLSTTQAGNVICPFHFRVRDLVGAAICLLTKIVFDSGRLSVISLLMTGMLNSSLAQGISETFKKLPVKALKWMAKLATLQCFSLQMTTKCELF